MTASTKIRKAKLRLDEVTECRGIPAFSSMDINFKGPRPAGLGRSDSFLILPHTHLGEPRCGGD